MKPSKAIFRIIQCTITPNRVAQKKEPWIVSGRLKVRTPPLFGFLFEIIEVFRRQDTIYRSADLPYNTDLNGTTSLLILVALVTEPAK